MLSFAASSQNCNGSTVITPGLPFVYRTVDLFRLRPVSSHIAGRLCRSTAACRAAVDTLVGSSSSFSRRSQRNPAELLSAVMFYSSCRFLHVIVSKTVSICCFRQSAAKAFPGFACDFTGHDFPVFADHRLDVWQVPGIVVKVMRESAFRVPECV